MAEQGDDLLVEVGLTEKRYLQSLARLEAQTVRTAKTAENRFARANRSTERGFTRVGKAAQGSSQGLRMAAMQLNQVAQQGAVTGNYLQALSIQLPDLLLGFGAFGAIIGGAAAALIPFASGLLSASDATEDLVAEILGDGQSLSSVRGIIAELRDLQDEYTDAIALSSTASGDTAAAVAANSKREYQARMQVLAVEIELLKTRRQGKLAEAEGIAQSVEQARQKALDDVRRAGTGTRLANGSNPLDPSIQPYVYGGPRGVSDIFTESELEKVAERGAERMREYNEETREARLALRRLNAEATLLEVGISEGERAVSGEFADGVGGGQSRRDYERERSEVGDKPSGSAGSGRSERQKELNRLLKEGEKLTNRLMSASERYAAEQGRLNRLLKTGAIDQETYQRAMLELEREFESVGATIAEVGQASASAIDQLFDAALDGADNATEALRNFSKELVKIGTYRILASKFPGTFGADGTIPLVSNALGNAFARGRVTAFARGGVVNGPTLFPMANGAGLMGEAGPEAVMPLKRINGRLGVEAAGGGANLQVNIINQAGVEVEQERRGGRLDVYLRKAVSETIGGGGADRAMKSRFGLRPNPKGG